jgi:RNA polymerase sigma-70 factor (ECF subfamily)
MANAGDQSNRERFERLFADQFDAVLAYALARADPETAQDAVADAFLVAWRRLDEVPDPARPWLLAVTRRTLATQRRSRNRQESVRHKIRLWDPEDATSLESPSRIDAEVAKLALDRMSEADRELLCLLAWDDLSQREAAFVLGCSIGAFRVRYLRARRRYRSAIDAELAGRSHVDHSTLSRLADEEKTA